MARANKSLAKRNKFLLLFGFLFFVNPVPLGLDFIPDVFGFILLYFGLAQLGYFDGAIEKAQKIALYGTVVEFTKLLLTKSIFLTEISSNRMLGVFVFSFLEIILYVAFFKQLFDGISYFSMRNNCNKTLTKCDGCAFLSFLSVGVRIVASLAPEMLSLIEQRKNITTDFKTIDLINDIMIAKPVLVLLLSLLAFITGVTWYISIFGLIKTLNIEAGEILDSRYFAEFSSKPQLTRPKKLKRISFWLYIALFCLLDISIDRIPITPPWMTFLILFVLCFAFKGLCDFDSVSIWTFAAFILFAGSDIFKRVFVPYGAVVIYETDIYIVIANAFISVITAIVCMYVIRSFLLKLSELSVNLGGGRIPITLSWVAFVLSMVLWVVGYTIPYLYASVAFWRIVFTAVFIWKTTTIITQINDEENYRASLMGNDEIL